MKKEPMIYRDLIYLDPTFASQHDLFQSLFQQLYEKGFVQADFLQAIEEREEKYPTAVPTKPFAIAIPHTDPESIIKPFVAVIRLRDKLLWKQMVSEEVITVKAVFLLGFYNHCEYHIRLLQKLMDLFLCTDFPDKLLKAKNVEECYRLVCTEIGNPE